MLAPPGQSVHQESILGRVRDAVGAREVRLNGYSFRLPDGFTLDSYLEHLAFEGLRARYGAAPADAVVDRLRYELGVSAAPSRRPAVNVSTSSSTASQSLER